MTRIVTTIHRPKRPPRRRKPVALKTAVVQAGKPGEVCPNLDKAPAIATSISRKRARLLRAVETSTAEPEPEEPDDPAALRAWLERAKWGRWPGEPDE